MLPSPALLSTMFRIPSYGIPSAAVTTQPALCWNLQATKQAQLWAGTKLAVLYPGADQDGFDGEVICRDAQGQEWAVPRGALRL